MGAKCMNVQAIFLLRALFSLTENHLAGLQHLPDSHLPSRHLCTVQEESDAEDPALVTPGLAASCGRTTAEVRELLASPTCRPHQISPHQNVTPARGYMQLCCCTNDAQTLTHTSTASQLVTQPRLPVRLVIERVQSQSRSICKSCASLPNNLLFDQLLGLRCE